MGNENEEYEQQEGRSKLTANSLQHHIQCKTQAEEDGRSPNLLALQEVQITNPTLVETAEQELARDNRAPSLGTATSSLWRSTMIP